MQFALPELTPKNVILAFIAAALIIGLWPVSPFLAAIIWVWKKTDYPKWVKITVCVLLLSVAGRVLPDPIVSQQAAVNVSGEANTPPSNNTATSTQAPVIVQNNSLQDITNKQDQTTATSSKVSGAPVEKKTAQTAPQQVQDQPTATLYAVVSVVDGDTIKITLNGKQETLRFIGMDTPETVDPREPVQCFGKEASNKAKELLSGKKITIELDPTQGERDKYGRLLVYVRREDGLFYNKYMIEQGFAHEYTYSVPYKYQVEFKAAQKAAQAAQRGLWSPNTCNGDTSKAAASPTPTTTTKSAPTPTEQSATQQPVQTTPTPAEQPVAEQPQAGSKFYTSSHHTASNYYPEACEGWKSLSTKYLKVFDSLKALLAAYPNRTLSSQCN